MSFAGVGSRMALLVAALFLSPHEAASAPLCAPGDGFRAKAQSAAHRKAWSSELRWGQAASSAYGRCAATTRGADYERLVYRKGLSLILVAGGVTGLREYSATKVANDARTLFRQVAFSADAPANLRARAAEDSTGIARWLPAVSSMRPDLAVIPVPRRRPVAQRRTIVARATYATVAAPVSSTPTPVPPTEDPAMRRPYDVLAAPWYTPGDGDVAYLHIRVNLHPAREVVVQPDQFRIDVQSQTGGHETVYGMMSPAPRYQATQYLAQGAPTVMKPAIAPNEDLGASSLHLRAGDSVTTVVTFRVRADADRSESVAQTLTWFPHSP